MTKLELQRTPLSVGRLTATALALPEWSNARFAYQKVSDGQTVTDGSPAGSYGPEWSCSPGRGRV